MMMASAMSSEERRMVYLAVSVLGLSIIAIILFVFGITIAFYILALVAIAAGYYFARSVPSRTQQQSGAQARGTEAGPAQARQQAQRTRRRAQTEQQD